MVEFLKIQFQLGNIDEPYLNLLVTKKRITLLQKAEIMSSGGE